ncbi:MAG TPA: hypothetical protein VE987_19040 [Polyangiaceae bacterium]|nr:hypothetical protein [Polyangiaceae bacterium]
MDIELAGRRRRAPKAAAVLLGAAAVAFGPAARAQGATPEDIASARVLGTEGVRLAEAGDCKGAIVKLAAAEKLYHAPTTLERLGECQVKVGQLIAGTEALNRVVRETLAPGAPQAFVAAQQRAGQVYAASFPRIGKLRIHVDGAPADKVSVTVDGVSVPSALLDAERPTDPGPHEVNATAAGYKTATTSVTLADGSTSAVSLSLEPDPNAAASATNLAGPAAQPGATQAGATPAPQPAAPTPDRTPPNRVPAFVLLGIGGAGIVVGSVFGIMALGTKSTLDNACPNKSCPNPSSQSDIDALGTRALVSNVGFGVGLVSAAVGTVLLVTAHGGESPAAGSTSTRRIAPWVGLGAAGVGGIFE